MPGPGGGKRRAQAQSSVDQPGERPARASRRSQSVRLTDRDRELLEFASEHKLFLVDHAAALLGMSPDAVGRRIRALVADGSLHQDRPFDKQPACYQITHRGLGAIESALGAPRAVDRAHYRHDVGLVWLWLAARAGVWGELSALVSERAMRSTDRSLQISDAARDAAAAGQRFGVRLGGTGPAGRERLHYPDLLLVDRDGRRIAVELELSAKSPPRREGILAGYAIDPRIDVVLYLVDRPAVARSVRGSARRLGISDLVHIQRVKWGKDAPRSGRGRAPARLPRRAPAEATADR
jgi:hypothetical protein